MSVWKLSRQNLWMVVLYVQSKNIWQLLAFYLTFISSHSRLLAHILSCIYFYSFKTFDTFVVLFYLDAYRSLKCWSGGVKGLPRRVTEGVQPNATNKLYFHLFLKPYCGYCFELKTSSCFCKHFAFNLFYQNHRICQANFLRENLMHLRIETIVLFWLDISVSFVQLQFQKSICPPSKLEYKCTRFLLLILLSLSYIVLVLGWTWTVFVVIFEHFGTHAQLVLTFL